MTATSVKENSKSEKGEHINNINSPILLHQAGGENCDLTGRGMSECQTAPAEKTKTRESVKLIQQRTGRSAKTNCQIILIQRNVNHW